MKRPMHTLPADQQAGILSNDPRFQKFAATRCGMTGTTFGTEATAEYIRTVCGITSRAELSRSTQARIRFDQLKTEFAAWSGRIARQQ